MRPNFITHIKDGVTLTFKLEDITFMKHQHNTHSQKEMFVVVIHKQLKMFTNQVNFDKIYQHWTSTKPVNKGGILTLRDTKDH